MQVIDLLRTRLKSYNKGKPLGNKRTSFASVMVYTKQNTPSNMFSFLEKKKKNLPVAII